MTPLAYTVKVTIEQRDLADEFVHWLRTGHIDEVLNAGAQAAQIIRLDSDAAGDHLTFEIRYVFPSRESFEGYQRDHAERLRPKASSDSDRIAGSR